MLYDFTCKNCGDIELIVSLGTEQIQCPNCGGQALRSHKPAQCKFNLVGHCWSRDGYMTQTEKNNAKKHGQLLKTLQKLNGKEPKGFTAPGISGSIMEDN